MTASPPVPADFVPGCPPKWQPPSLPQSLHEDGGIYFRDPNAARYPAFPTEPAVRAIFHQDAQNALHDSDLFACGNTFGSLLSVARDEDRTFRFDVERVGQTLFLVRKTNTGNPCETIEEVRGYGHTFPEAYTVWEPEVKGSASHQRIIKYDFMGFKIMIRSECDGYLSDLLLSSELNGQNPALHTTTQQPDLDAALPSLSLGFNGQDSTATKDLVVTQTGKPIPQHAIFDLKTRSIKTKDRMINDMEQFYPRLWANQTPNFVLAFHQWGKFEKSNIHVKNIADEIKAWEKRSSSILRRLGGILKKLVDLSKMKGTARFEVRRVGKGPIEVWSEISGWSALPDELKVRLKEAQGCSEHDSDDVEDEADGNGGANLEHDSSDEDEGDDADYLKF